MQGWIVDLSFLAIAIATVIIFTKRGFVKSVFRYGRGIVSFVLAFTFGSSLGDWLNEKFIFHGIYSWTFSKIQTVLSVAAGKIDVDTLFDNLPFLVKQFVSEDALKAQFGHVLENAEESAEAFSRAVSAPLAGLLANLVAYLLIMAAASVALLLIGILFDLLTKLPVIRQINTFLGFVVGAFSAFLLLALLTYLISLAVGVVLSVEAYADLQKNTIIFNWFDNIHLFELF